MARSVNFVWNYCNELSERSIRERQKWLSGFDLQKYTAGSSKQLGLNAQSVQLVCQQYARSRSQFKKRRIAWRKSTGVHKSLGWVPTNPQQAKWKNNSVFHNGTYFKVFDSYGLHQYKFRAGSFNEDSRGKWYFNVVVEVNVVASEGRASVGIDLGCKDAVTTSEGETLTGRWYREIEPKLVKAQRAKKKKRVAAVHAKAANRRKDALHKMSRKLVNTNALIVVGNVSPTKMAKTRMAKSALDAGWAMLKTMLVYKCDHAGIVFKEVNEAFSSQTCSCCGSRPQERPRGIAGLGIREWTCGNCGATHDRDVNAARNILRIGLDTLEEGASACANE